MTFLCVSVQPKHARVELGSGPDDCAKRLIDWKNEEDLGIRIYYAPPGLAWHPPIIFLPISPLDQRLGDLDREVISVTPTEMRALAAKLAVVSLEWKADDTTESLFPGFWHLATELDPRRLQFMVSCGKGSCEAYLDPARLCEVLSTFDSSITTVKALWHFQAYRANLGCKVDGYNGYHPSEFVFTSAPFKSAHASSIVALSNGGLLAAWFGGTAEGNPDVAIWASRRTSAGWSAPFQIVREPNTPTWNPVFFHSKDARLWLYYKFGAGPSTWKAARMFSADEGKTWSQPERLPDGILGPIKNKPLVLLDGTIVSGSSVETPQSWNVWIERSTDNGMTWSKFGPLSVPRTASSTQATPYGIIQPTIISLNEGNHLRLYARSTLSIGFICTADSFDNGVTWTQAHPTNIPNPNSGIDAVKLRDGRIILVYNNTRTGRTPLNLAVSSDGEHFKMFATLESDPGEFSYPATIQGSDDALHITYTWNRTRIKYVRIPISEIPK